ncbi:MAG TPA: Hpt domain-containing protein, partial [Xanthomonadales bacterium]|nr:Hpt domain-containing protein [Xanthomonadales bacterium]
MMLEGTNASAAIRWVRQDLDLALQAVRDNLEAFAANTAERGPLRTVQEQLELLNLTFKTMEQRGASILTDEMIAVGGHMLNQCGTSADEPLAALTDAVIVLPSYLDRLQAGHDDLPILLLPTLNELRATYDESLLSEGTLFAPPLDVMIPELAGSESGVVSRQDFDTFARRIRNQYQATLVAWLKEQSKVELLVPLQGVCNTLHMRLGRYSLRRLWWIAEMTIAGFHAGAVDNDLPLRRLFARLDMTLKAMAEGGQEGPAEEAITALSRALLFHAAQARPGSKPADNLRQRFRLEELIPDREALLRARGAVTGRDAELFRSIGNAIREEMSLVKDTLDMELRTGRVEKEQRESSLTALRQLADTLNMLNLPVPARAVEELLPGLEQTGAAENNELDSPLLKLARKLIEVESLLDAHISLLGEPVEESAWQGYIGLSAHEQRSILSCLLDQCIISLQETQESIRKQLNGEPHADFAELLTSISGALQLAGQGEVAELTNKLCRALHAGLHAKASGASDENARLIPLADAVAALELYLAGCRDEQTNSLRYLEIMHERLDGLPEATASGVAVEGTSIRLPPRLQAKPAPGEVPPISTHAPEVPGDVLPAIAAIDQDLLAVFLEEFDGVARQLSTQLPKWLEDAGNTQHLAEIKRGFHTFKGSGRMVGAVEIGDFAWRMEEVLNRVAEARLAADVNVTGLLRLALAALPELRARLLQQPGELKAADIASFNLFGQRLARDENPRLDTLLRTLPEAFVARALGQATDGGTAPQQADLPAPIVEPAALTAGPAQAASPAREDNELARLMAAEISQYIADIERFVSGSNFAADAQLVRSAHTLAGTLALSPLGQEAEVARGLERYFEALLTHDEIPGQEGKQAVLLCQHRFRQRLYILENGEATSYPLQDEQLLAVLFALTAAAGSRSTAQEAGEAVAADPASATEAQSADALPKTISQPASADPHTTERLRLEDGGILSIFLEEAAEVLERCDTLLNTWRDRLADQKLVQNLQREIHTFKGGARMADLEPLGDLSHAMETLLERIAANRLQATVAAVQALEEGCDRLTLWVEQLHAGSMPEPGDALSRFDNRVRALSVLPAGKPAPMELQARKEPTAPKAPAPETPAEPSVPALPV